MSTKSLMREAIVSKGPTVKLVDSPIPRPSAGQVVIKVAVSGSNPKDWKYPEFTDLTLNAGDDIAGTVHEVGNDVYEFAPGDRVAAFHVMGTSGGSFAEYAISPANTAFRLPPQTSFEEGAAIPLAALTAAVGLYHGLGLPEPWVGTEERLPLVIYGASSAVGNYALQFAKRSNIHPIIVIAGRAQAYVESFLEPAKGDVMIDYRQGSEAVVNGIKVALGTAPLFHAYDAISEHGSYQSICQVLKNPGGKIAVVMPRRKYEEIPGGIEKKIVNVGTVHENLQDLGYVYSRYISRGLQEGWFKPLPQEVVPGGLEGVETGLRNLKEGKASATKYVFRIADTPGIEKGRL